MARSASRLLTAAAGPTLLLTVLTGCATTQQEAARLRVNAARTRASELAVRVTRPNPDVVVQGVQLVAGRRESALVVRLRNVRAHPVSDLPISVGVTVHGARRRYLNGARGSDYFLTHIPAIPANSCLTWVFTTRRSIGARSSVHPFALVGVQMPPITPPPRALPRLTAAAMNAAGGERSGPQVRVLVRNLSSVPQYGLQLYLVARRAGRDVSAGRATVAHLTAQASTALRIRLVGNPQPGTITLEASPTIYG